MATYEDFLPQIKPMCFGVPDPVVELFLRRAAIEFCKRTRIYTVLTQAFAFKDDGRVYFDSLDNNEEQMETVVAGWFKGVPMTPRPARAARAPHEFAAASFSADAQRGNPQEFFEIVGERDNVGVYPLPSAQEADAFTFKVALRPSDKCTVIPDLLLRDWNEAMVAGALKGILATKGQSYSDPQGQIDQFRLFERKVLEGRMASETGMVVQQDLQVTMQPFVPGRR